MDAHVIQVKCKRFVKWMYVVALSSWTIPAVFCENTTTPAVCDSCDLAQRHKLYNWLVLCIVLLLLVLLLLLVAFLCHRMWPRDSLVLERAVGRYNVEEQQGVLSDLTQVSSSSWGTSNTPAVTTQFSIDIKNVMEWVWPSRALFVRRKTYVIMARKLSAWPNDS